MRTQRTRKTTAFELFTSAFFAIAASMLAVPANAMAATPTLTFADPAGDDFGPGTYSYPTDAAHTPGSYDLREVTVRSKGRSVEITVKFAAKISDPWYSKGWADPGNGFSLQMVQLYLDTEPKAGRTSTLPGVQAQFAKEDGWEKVVLISPQSGTRLKREVKKLAGGLGSSVVIPRKVVAQGHTLTVTVRRSDLGSVPSDKWGLQAVVMGSDGFPGKTMFLARRVNELPGQHRFGGGRDDQCDPNILDILAGKGTGDATESDAQKAALRYVCGPSGDPTTMATLPMIRRAVVKPAKAPVR